MPWLSSGIGWWLFKSEEQYLLTVKSLCKENVRTILQLKARRLYFTAYKCTLTQSKRSPLERTLPLMFAVATRWSWLTKYTPNVFGDIAFHYENYVRNWCCYGVDNLMFGRFLTEYLVIGVRESTLEAVVVAKFIAQENIKWQHVGNNEI